MSETWAVVLLVGAAAMTMKAAGPVAIGGRELPVEAARLVGALAPALLSALVVTNTFADGTSFALDARVVGVAAAAVCIGLRAPLLAAVVVAAAAAALVRAAGG